jgi:hypothetical protein
LFIVEEVAAPGKETVVLLSIGQKRVAADSAIAFITLKSRINLPYVLVLGIPLLYPR